MFFGITASAAAIKSLQVIEELIKICDSSNIMLNIKCALSERSLIFIDNEEKKKLESRVEFYYDSDELVQWKVRGDPILHIEIRKWATHAVVLPLSANTLGKIANGLCDNLISCVLRAWDFKNPILIFPCMNTLMWQHPVTDMQLKLLLNFGYKIEYPIEKKLLCGDEGKGALPTVENCVYSIYSLF